MPIFVEHYIEREILRRLSRSQGMPFSALKPHGLENNIFSYHLKQLLGQGLITKTNDNHYRLTHTGIQYVSWATRTNLDILPQPKIFCLLVITNELGEHILLKRHAQPFMDRYTFPGGVLFFGESLEELTKRQLAEKTGLSLPLAHRGIAHIRASQNGHIVSHSQAHIMYGQVEGRPTLRGKDVRFAPEWKHITQVPAAELMPDITDILRAVTATDRYFFLDLEIAHEPNSNAAEEAPSSGQA